MVKHKQCRHAWAVTVAVALVATVAWAREGRTISLLVGTQKVIIEPHFRRIEVADPSIVDVVTIGNSQVLLIGTGEGETTLHIWTRSDQRVSYQVRVSKRRTNEVTREVE